MTKVILTVGPDKTTVERPAQAMTQEVSPTDIYIILPTGEKVSIDVVLQHLEQEFGPWPK